MTAERYDTWAKYLLGIVAGISVSIAIGGIVTYGKMTAMQENVLQNKARMDAMEQGLTTPMSVVTRERFDALEKRLIRIEERLERLVDQFHSSEGVERKKLKRNGAAADQLIKPPEVGG